MTIKFNDISHYQGTGFPCDGPIIAKATEGSTFTDSAYSTNKTRTLGNGFPFCAYHFPLAGSVGGSMQAQANHALAVIGTDTGVMMDIEKDVHGHWPTRDECLQQIDLMHAKNMRVTLAYIPHWFQRDYWAGASLAGFADRGLGLVSSSYVATYTDSGVGWNPYGGMTPIIWQYTDGDTSRGYSYGMHGIDTNAFKGDIAQLSALFSGTSGDGSIPGDIMTISPEDLTAIANKVWTYKPGWANLLDETPLGMLADLRVVRDQLVAGAHSVDEIAAAVVAALPPASGGTPAPISDADVARIATAVLDGFAQRTAE